VYALITSEISFRCESLWKAYCDYVTEFLPLQLEKWACGVLGDSCAIGLRLLTGWNQLECVIVLSWTLTSDRIMWLWALPY